MTDTAHRVPARRTPAHTVRRRPPFFRPVPLRARRDGWSAARQAGFLGHLYLTGSVSAAARAVGMSRMAAYRLRARAGAEDFARAWDRVLEGPGSGRAPRPRPDWRKVTDATVARIAEAGFVRPVLYRGRVAGVQRKADNTMLLRALRRHDAASARSLAKPSGRAPRSFAKPPGRCANRPASVPGGAPPATPPQWERCSPLIQRTVPLEARMTTLSVVMRPPRRYFTPSSSEPEVTPVAAKMQSPRTRSSRV